MDKLTTYRDAIKKVLRDFAELANRSPQKDAETLCAFDEARDHYLLLNTGWSGEYRLRGNTLFIRIKNGKVWIEEDWTEDGIVDDLMQAGIPKEDIVLGFHPPEVRARTEFAVA
jgi:hypothetical protein